MYWIRIIDHDSKGYLYLYSTFVFQGIAKNSDCHFSREVQPTHSLWYYASMQTQSRAAVVLKPNLPIPLVHLP